MGNFFGNFLIEINEKMSLKLIKLHLNSCQDPLINYLALDASEGEIITVVDGTWLRSGSFGFVSGMLACKRGRLTF